MKTNETWSSPTNCPIRFKNLNSVLNEHSYTLCANGCVSPTAKSTCSFIWSSGHPNSAFSLLSPAICSFHFPEERKLIADAAAVCAPETSHSLLIVQWKNFSLFLSLVNLFLFFFFFCISLCRRPCSLAHTHTYRDTVIVGSFSVRLPNSLPQRKLYIHCVPSPRATQHRPICEWLQMEYDDLECNQRPLELASWPPYEMRSMYNRNSLNAYMHEYEDVPRMHTPFMGNRKKKCGKQKHIPYTQMYKHTQRERQQQQHTQTEQITYFVQDLHFSLALSAGVFHLCHIQTLVAWQFHYTFTHERIYILWVRVFSITLGAVMPINPIHDCKSCGLLWLSHIRWTRISRGFR